MPVIPLVAQLRAQAEDAHPGSGWRVHDGATSQDILDSALVLVAKRVLDAVRGRLVAAGESLGGLAEAERSTVSIARTLGQHAEATTVGAQRRDLARRGDERDRGRAGRPVPGAARRRGRHRARVRRAAARRHAPPAGRDGRAARPRRPRTRLAHRPHARAGPRQRGRGGRRGLRPHRTRRRVPRPHRDRRARRRPRRRILGHAAQAESRRRRAAHRERAAGRRPRRHAARGGGVAGRPARGGVARRVAGLPLAAPPGRRERGCRGRPRRRAHGRARRDRAHPRAQPELVRDRDAVVAAAGAVVDAAVARFHAVTEAAR